MDPNPARDDQPRLPKEVRVPISPPSASDVEAILASIHPRYRLPIRVLEQTGLRIGELAALTWGDVDEASGRLRVANGKTAAARRWVEAGSVIGEIAATCPVEDRTPERKVFLGCNPNGAKNAMGRACRFAGIASFSPHDLRHRYVSLMLKRGVPVAEVAAQVGHSRTSLTHDVYTHVVVD